MPSSWSEMGKDDQGKQEVPSLRMSVYEQTHKVLHMEKEGSRRISISSGETEEMRIRVALIISEDRIYELFKQMTKSFTPPPLWICRRAETPQEKDQQAKKIQKEIGSYLKGGTRKLPGITGKEKIQAILSRIKNLKISGEDKLIQRLGKARYDQIVLRSKADLIKGYLSLAKARGIELPDRNDLKKIPKDIREEAQILVFEDKLIRRQSGYSRWERVEGGRYWRDSHGRFSKGPTK